MPRVEPAGSIAMVALHAPGSMNCWLKMWQAGAGDAVDRTVTVQVRPLPKSIASSYGVVWAKTPPADMPVNRAIVDQIIWSAFNDACSDPLPPE